MRNFQGMRKERFSGAPRLSFVLFGGEVIRPAKKLEIVTRPVPVHLIRQLGKAQIHRAASRRANRRFP
jgi:hypothetical protein